MQLKVLKPIGFAQKSWSSLKPVLSVFVDVIEVEDDDADWKILDTRSPVTDMEAKPGSKPVWSVLLTQDEEAPQLWIDGKIDSVLVSPFRSAEVAQVIRAWENWKLWRQIENMNQQFGGTLDQLKSDLTLLTQMQKLRLPQRFLEPRGFKVRSRYLSGLKPGGEYFDLIETEEGDRLVLLMTDASSYGLSGALINVLMRVAVKVHGRDLGSLSSFIRRIQDEMLASITEKENLSIWVVVISKKDLSLRYVGIGGGILVRAPMLGEAQFCKPQAEAIRKSARFREVEEGTLKLEPGDRLIYCSDGFTKLGGDLDQAWPTLISKFRQQESTDLLNELAYIAKKDKADDFPAEDCTAIVMDVDQKIIRLA